MNIYVLVICSLPFIFYFVFKAEKVTQLSHNISMLMSVEVKEDEVYSCAARNEAGSSSRKSCHVYAVPKGNAL